MNDLHLIELDGAHGEGGGQILRSALTLSMITGQPFRISQIRARRSKPGLLRQHLTAVQAAQAISGATVEGADIGSQTLLFQPGPLRQGDYRFAIGTAGSCTLVLQTVLPALWYAAGESSVTVSGGTHNRTAPPADFLIDSWLPLMQKMGAKTELELLRHGFYPAGGGEIRAKVAPSRLQALTLTERGARLGVDATAVVAAVPGHVAQRELERISAKLGHLLRSSRINALPPSHGPGNVVMIRVEHEQITETFVGFGERGLSAEAVAEQAAGEAYAYLNSQAAVGEHLADQLALPIALAGAGRFTTSVVSEHLRTNLQVIEKFLPVETSISAVDQHGWLVEISA
ncbi:RNA 3'-terminal phosphate cyclase [Chitinimonas lacunae]|uniref:RNA 3'-terminal phosphate cyclase n=1 Tax=Chitinimonas lacunae TaxID=1963018 RepID=A0ABV8MPJ9_9NEIS